MSVLLKDGEPTWYRAARMGLLVGFLCGFGSGIGITILWFLWRTGF